MKSLIVAPAVRMTALFVSGAALLQLVAIVVLFTTAGFTVGDVPAALLTALIPVGIFVAMHYRLAWKATKTGGVIDVYWMFRRTPFLSLPDELEASSLQSCEERLAGGPKLVAPWRRDRWIWSASDDFVDEVLALAKMNREDHGARSSKAEKT